MVKDVGVDGGAYIPTSVNGGGVDIPDDVVPLRFLENRDAEDDFRFPKTGRVVAGCSSIGEGTRGALLPVILRMKMLETVLRIVLTEGHVFLRCASWPFLGAEVTVALPLSVMSRSLRLTIRTGTTVLRVDGTGSSRLRPWRCARTGIHQSGIKGGGVWRTFKGSFLLSPTLAIPFAGSTLLAQGPMLSEGVKAGNGLTDTAIWRGGAPLKVTPFPKSEKGTLSRSGASILVGRERTNAALIEFVGESGRNTRSSAEELGEKMNVAGSVVGVVVMVI